MTPSRFDKFLDGDEKALTDAEKAGLETFMDAGCTACHMGEGVGGAMYQKLGLVKPVPGLKDNGRFDVTKKDADKFFFKVPSLRNIEKTGPVPPRRQHEDRSRRRSSFMGELPAGQAA